MGYVAVKGGRDAIVASQARLTYERLAEGRVLDVADVRAGLRGAIDQVMSEASLYDEDVAALALKQAEGSPEEAVFLLRAFRSTLPRLHHTRTADTRPMHVERRISATFKDVPGGQLLGASYDYVHRLLDPDLRFETDADARAWLARWRAEAEAAASAVGTPEGGDAEAGEGPDGASDALPKVLDYLRTEGLMEARADDDRAPGDVTKAALSFPAGRSRRLQVLTRGQTGVVTALGYASLRGFGPMLHPTVGELRVGRQPLSVPDPDAVADQIDDPEEDHYLGTVRLTEVETVVPVAVSAAGPQDAERTALGFDLGYGACFGRNETKAIAMSLLDQTLEHPDPRAPTHDEEFVLLHVDAVEASGFISHLKLPHYVTFQSELDAVRRTRAAALGGAGDADDAGVAGDAPDAPTDGEGTP
ncbi:MAG: carbon-phosphorus lyase complex subunit PhnI [Trueperaceae bacterium]|nr:carbon-phosphorus lyase complex subunit PhnI [Trueperaceae bacterium]